MKSENKKPNRKGKTVSREDETFEIAGKKIKVGQKMSPEEAEEFIRAILEMSPGPVTIENTDERTGTTTKASVNEWKDFTKGPQTNKAALEDNISNFEKQGYLSLYDRTTGDLKDDNKFITLLPEYFTDFDHFERCQDIPRRYFRPVKSSTTSMTWFVSHRWTSLRHPDPNGEQFGLIREFAGSYQVEGIWYDYACMPQDPLTDAESALFRDSLRDLNALITSTNFLAITTEDYENRAWCYYEMMIAELLCGSKKARIAPRNYSSSVDKLVPMLVVEGKTPELAITKEADRMHVQKLLSTGVKLFKTLSIAMTLDILNSFGFKFGVGAASRYSELISFEQLWMAWQILAGSSEHSGIKLRHLFDPDRLKKILLQRHERFGTHSRIFSEIPNLTQSPLDLRIVEQESLEFLQKLIGDSIRMGPVKENFTNLAIIKLVYSIAAI